MSLCEKCAADCRHERLPNEIVVHCGSYRPPMTNGDLLCAMTIEEKAEFISSIAYARKTPWCEPFAEKFCKSCPTTTCTIEEYSHTMELHECDFADGKCPHGSDIVWWLQQPVEEV